MILTAIIEIVNKAVSTVTTTDTTAEKNIVEELSDCTDLWEIKKYTEDDFWFMKVGRLCHLNPSICLF